MKDKKYNIAIVGATGLVGQTMLSIIEQCDFPVDKVFALASSRSAGEKILFKGNDLVVEELVKQIQKEVERTDFSEMLIWLFIQNHQFQLLGIG